MIKSPIQVHRTRSYRPASVAPQPKGTDVKRVLSERLGSAGFPKVKEKDGDTSCCYETAFTTAEPQTRMIVRQSRLLTLSRRSQSSDLILEERAEASNGKLDPRQRNSEVWFFFYVTFKFYFILYYIYVLGLSESGSIAE